MISLQDGVVVSVLCVCVEFKVGLTCSRSGFRETVTVNFKFDAIATLAMKHRAFIKRPNGRKSSERLPFVYQRLCFAHNVLDRESGLACIGRQISCRKLRR